jgi:hypothetical protein
MLMLADGLRWALRHWLLVSCLSTIVVTAWLNRCRLGDLGASLKWRYVPSRHTRKRILQTMRLLDRRLRFAELSRPSGATFSTWLRRQQTHLQTPREKEIGIAEFLQLADWAVYGVDDLEAAGSSADVEVSCRLVTQVFTLAELRKSATAFRNDRSAAAAASNRSKLNPSKLNSSNPEIAYS